MSQNKLILGEKKKRLWDGLQIHPLNCSNFTHFLKLKLSVPTVVQLSYVTPGPCPSTNVSHGLDGSNPTKLTLPQEHWDFVLNSLLPWPPQRKAEALRAIDSWSHLILNLLPADTGGCISHGSCWRYTHMWSSNRPSHNPLPPGWLLEGSAVLAPAN